LHISLRSVLLWTVRRVSIALYGLFNDEESPDSSDTFPCD